MVHAALAQISLIAFISIVSQWLAWRLRVPAIVLLLLLGFLLGSVFDIIQPRLLLGDVIQPVVSVAVAIILFEGSLNLNFREIRQAQRVVWQVVLIGGAVSWFFTSIAGHYLGGLSWATAITFGALLIVTGPTVIMPILRHARLNVRMGSMLKWEGIINDPIGAVLAVLAYEYFKISGETGFNATHFVFYTAFTVLAVMVLSIFSGLLLARILNRGYVPEFLKPFFLLSIVVCFFVICNMILHDSGLIAVTILGIVLANQGVNSIDDLRRFKESITILLISGVFVILTASIKPEILLNIDWRGALFVLAVLFVVRPISMIAASIGSSLNWKETILLSLIAPRGVVCAAVAGVMGPLLVNAGFPDGEKLLPLAFAIVLITVFLHGLWAKPLAQRLGLAFPSKDGLIIVGATEWSMQLAEVLKSKEIDVIIADRDWLNLKNARLANLPVYYGEILSDETEYAMELNRYNLLLAATGNPAYNALVCNSFAHDFGREHVFQLAVGEEDMPERQRITATMRGRNFASDELDYWGFVRLFRQGWRFKATKVSAEFNLDTLKQQRADGLMKLIGVVRPGGQLIISQTASPDIVKNDNIAILFVKEEEKKAEGT